MKESIDQSSQLLESSIANTRATYGEEHSE
jgi:hypothetical protein